MKTKAFLSASRQALLALACVTAITLTACGGSDDDPKADSPSGGGTSEKTTPVTFQLNNGISYMFDYAAGRYAGSDTIEVYNGKYYADGSSFPNNVEIDLSVGQHQVVWFELLGRTADDTRFDPHTKTVTIGKGQAEPTDVRYAECSMNVSEYLLPTQKLEYAPLSARVEVMLSDKPSAEAAAGADGKVVAKVKGLPLVTSAELFGNGYTKSDATAEGNMEIDPSKSLIPGIFTSGRILCPKEGLDDIQLQVEVMGKDGRPMATTVLPKISIRRGHVTILYGPLFSGSTADWQVATPSAEEYEKSK